jgi:hypothetical protein
MVIGDTEEICPARRITPAGLACIVKIDADIIAGAGDGAFYFYAISTRTFDVYIVSARGTAYLKRSIGKAVAG